MAKDEALDELKRVKAPLDTVLLDEIARGIADLKKLMSSQVPEGLKDEVEVSVHGKVPVPMQPRTTMPPYFRATIFNDGPDPVYVMLNDVKAEPYRKAPLNAGDKIDIDTTEAKIRELYFACEGDANSAALRIHLLK